MRHYAIKHFKEELLEKLKLEGDPPFVCNSCTQYTTPTLSLLGQSSSGKPLNKAQHEEKILVHFAITHRGVVEILEEQEYKMILKTGGKSNLQTTKYQSPTARNKMTYWVRRQWLVKECVEERLNLTYLAKKWTSKPFYCNPGSIKEWVAEAGLTVPEQNRVAIYPATPFRPTNCKLVFCHMEIFRSSFSPTVHLTQLAATNTTNLCNVFLPIIPSILDDLLDRYRVGNLLEAMKMVREDRSTFIFREKVLVSETKRLECVQEGKAMELFFKYLELAGPNVVLVGVDENAIGVLLQKLESYNAAKFLQLVVGYTWWRRILAGGAYDMEREWRLDDFHAYKTKKSNTYPVVAARLRNAVRKVALRQGKGKYGGFGGLETEDQQILSDFADRVGISMMVEPRVTTEEIEANEKDREVVELTNSFLPVPSTSFILHKLDKVDISSDSDNEWDQVQIDCDQAQGKQLGEYFEEDEVKLEVKGLKKETFHDSFGEYVEMDNNDEIKNLQIEPVKDTSVKHQVGERIEEEVLFERNGTKSESVKEAGEYVKKDTAKFELNKFKTESFKEYMEIQNIGENKDIQIEPVKGSSDKSNVGEYFEEEIQIERKDKKIGSLKEATHSAGPDAGEYVEDDRFKFEGQGFKIESFKEFSGEYVEKYSNIESKDQIGSVRDLSGNCHVGEYIEEESHKELPNGANAGEQVEKDEDSKYIYCETRTSQDLSENGNEPLWFCPRETSEDEKEDEEKEIENMEEEEEEEDVVVVVDEEEVAVVKPAKKKPLKRLRTFSEEEKTRSMRDFKMMAQFRKRAPKKKNRW